MVVEIVQQRLLARQAAAIMRGCSPIPYGMESSLPFNHAVVRYSVDLFPEGYAY